MRWEQDDVNAAAQLPTDKRWTVNSVNGTAQRTIRLTIAGIAEVTSLPFTNGDRRYESQRWDNSDIELLTTDGYRQMNSQGRKAQTPLIRFVADLW